MTQARTALLIIRAWIEHGSSKPLRAHLRHTTDIENGFTTDVTLADVDAVSSAVHIWLKAIIAASVPPAHFLDDPSK